MWQKIARYVPGHPWDLEKFPTFERCAQAAWHAPGRATLLPVPKNFGQKAAWHALWRAWPIFFENFRSSTFLCGFG